MSIKEVVLYLKNNKLIVFIVITIVIFIVGYALFPAYNTDDLDQIKQDEVTGISQNVIDNVKDQNDSTFINPYNISLPSDVVIDNSNLAGQTINAYKLTDWSQSEISTLLSVNVEYIDGYGYKFTNVENINLLPNYLQNLNNLGVGTFSIEKSDEVIETFDNAMHGDTAYLGNEGLVRVSIYNIYLDGRLLLVSNSLSEIIIVEDVASGKILKADFPNFFLKGLEGVSAQNFTEGTYNFSPVYNAGGGFDSLIYLSGAGLPNASNFSLQEGSLNIVYIYYPESSILVPHLSKKALLNGDDYLGLKNKEFYFISN